ncbi:MAG: cyclic nucleotide-binding domain-containing protein [Pseudomonadota bacterium]|nr:cyclic nucleotide-binding domain-containing protein [Pseudomonadota bacterium]
MDSDLLPGFVPLNSLSDEALSQAAEQGREVPLAVGQLLFQRGDADASCYYLLAGQIALDAGNGTPPLLIRAGSEAARHPLARLKPRRYSALAQTPCRIAAFDEAALDGLIAQDLTTACEVMAFAGNDPYWMFDLLRNPAFANVPQANLHALFERFQPKPVKAGEVVVHQGDPVGDYYYLIREGHAQVVRRNEAGWELVLAKLGPGDGFGEEALIAHAARNATVAMLSDGLVMCLSAADFDTLLKEPLVRKASPSEALKLLRGGHADLIDVRLTDEFKQGSLKGSFNIPLCLLRLRAGTLDSRRVHILVCDNERLSSIAAFILAQRGLDARVLAGGLGALKQASDKTPD